MAFYPGWSTIDALTEIDRLKNEKEKLYCLLVQSRDENEMLREALETMLEEFGARLSDGKPLGYTAGSMNRALRMVKAASVALDRARGPASDETGGER